MKNFNVIITGIGGQGSITLALIIAEAALKQGYDVKTSEFHGLAQRGGSVPCHVRFDEKIFSPIVLEGNADLIFGLEPLEALRSCYYGSRENSTTFLVDSRKIVPISVPVSGEKYPSLDEIKKDLKSFGEKVIILNASEKTKALTGNVLATNVYLLGYAYAKKFIPIKKKFLLDGMKEIFRENLFEINKKVFDAGEKDGS